MGVSTKGLLPSHVTVQDIKQIIEQKFGVNVTESDRFTDNFTQLYFTINGENDGEEENRILSISTEYTDLRNHEFLPDGTEKITHISLSYWGSAIHIIESILKEFGGYIIESDTNEDNYREVPEHRNKTMPLDFRPVLKYAVGVYDHRNNNHIVEVVRTKTAFDAALLAVTAATIDDVPYKDKVPAETVEQLIEFYDKLNISITPPKPV